jgi:hypothetical protein
MDFVTLEVVMCRKKSRKEGHVCISICMIEAKKKVATH